MRISDWSSDVCSSDLAEKRLFHLRKRQADDALRLSEREADRQTFQPADEHRFDARRLAREFEPFQARQQLLHQNPHLHPREMLAEANVCAEADRTSTRLNSSH